ncbi:GNAT family N-acetyltransferase [Blastococcus sp. SYSU D00669]
MSVQVVPATADRWDDVVAVFEGPGDAGRCWCQWFYRGAAATPERAAANRDALAGQVRGERPPGVLGYVDGVPSGWAAVGPRPSYTRLTNGQLLRGTAGLDDPAVWAVTCFVVRRAARRRGLAGELLAGALDLARAGGAGEVEGYPVDVAERPRASSAELFHGTLSVFERAGFREVARPQPARPVVRLRLG